MTTDEARQLAQTDPVPNLTKRWGEVAAHARVATDALVNALRELEKLEGQLAERGLTVATDLGPIGNAAAAARRDLEKQKPGPTFELPR